MAIPQVQAVYLWIVEEIRPAVFQAILAGDHDITSVGHAQGIARVLFHEQQGDPCAVDALDSLEHHTHDRRG